VLCHVPLHRSSGLHIDDTGFRLAVMTVNGTLQYSMRDSCGIDAGTLSGATLMTVTTCHHLAPQQAEPDLQDGVLQR